jgi:hypothetical protein
MRRATLRNRRAVVLDTNPNGKRDDYVEANQPVDPTKDTRIRTGLRLCRPPHRAGGDAQQNGCSARA